MSRTRWLVVGLGIGASAQRKADRALRQRLEALGPDHMIAQGRDRLTGQAHRVRASIAEAIDEGRTVQRERETELHARRGSARSIDAPPGQRERSDVIDLLPRNQPVTRSGPDARSVDDNDPSESVFDRIPPPVPRGRSRGKRLGRGEPVR